MTVPSRPAPAQAAPVITRDTIQASFISGPRYFRLSAMISVGVNLRALLSFGFHPSFFLVGSIAVHPVQSLSFRITRQDLRGEEARVLKAAARSVAFAGGRSALSCCISAMSRHAMRNHFITKGCVEELFALLHTRAGRELAHVNGRFVKS